MSRTNRTKRAWALLIAISLLMPGTALTAPTAFADTPASLLSSSTGFVDGIAVGIPTEAPEGAITYTGTIGPNIALSKVYASITAKNDTYSNVSGTIKLQTLNSVGVPTRTTTKEVVFAARRNNDRSLFDIRHGIDSDYTPGESFLLTFTVGGVEVARFEQGASVDRNLTNQIYNYSNLPSSIKDNIQEAVSPSNPVWSWPTTYGEAKVARWEDNRIGALVITVDDNLINHHPTWRRLLNYYDLPISWVVVGGDNFNHGEYESWRSLQEMGMGLESHAYSHFNTITTTEVTPERTQLVLDEYIKSTHAISQLTGGVVPMVIAFPGGNNNVSSADRLMGWNYFATGRTVYSPISALSAGDNVEAYHYIDTIETLFDPTVTRYNASGYGGVGSIYFHAVGSGSDTATAASILRLAHENRDKLWTGTASDVNSYSVERETATLTTVSATPGAIQLNLTDLLHDDTFQYPLTLKVKIGETWEGVKVTQNGVVSYGTIQTVDGVKQALVKAIPDRGVITVEPVSAAVAAAGTPKRAALSDATLYSLDFTTEHSVSRPVPGFSSEQEGGEYTLYVPLETDTITVASRTTYTDATVSYSHPNGQLNLSSGNQSLTVTVTSANNSVTRSFVVNVVKDAAAAPLVASVHYEDRFNDILRLTTTSTDPARWNGLSSALTGANVNYVDPENREHNTVFKLRSTAATTNLYKNYIYPLNGKLAFSSKLYIPSNAATNNGSFRLQIASTDIIRFVWDATESNYKWYIGGTSETTGGVYGGRVYPDRWLNLSVVINAADTGVTLSDRWGNSTVQARISQAAAGTGDVVSATASKTGVAAGGIDNSTGRTALWIGLVNASAGASLYLDDTVIYEPGPGALISETFNSGTTSSAPEGWTTGTTIPAAIAEIPSASDKSVRLSDTTTTDESWMSKSFTAQSGAFTAQFQFMQPTMYDWFRAYLNSGTTYGPSLYTIDGMIKYRNSSGTIVNVQPYSANTWYTVRLIANPSTDTYDIYVNDELKVSGATFYNAVANLDTISFASGVATTGTTYIDSVYVWN